MYRAVFVMGVIKARQDASLREAFLSRYGDSSLHGRSLGD